MHIQGLHRTRHLRQRSVPGIFDGTLIKLQACTSVHNLDRPAFLQPAVKSLRVDLRNFPERQPPKEG
jgi:hypothetical protein